MLKIAEVIEGNLIDIEGVDDKYVWHCIPKDGIGSYYYGQTNMIQTALIKATVKAYINVISESPQIEGLGIVNSQTAVCYSEGGEELFKPNLKFFEERIPIHIKNLFLTLENCHDFFREVSQQRKIEKVIDYQDYLGNPLGKVNGMYEIVQPELFKKIKCPIVLVRGFFMPEDDTFKNYPSPSELILEKR